MDGIISFFLSLLILWTEGTRLRLSPLAGNGAALTVAVFVAARVLPSAFVSLLLSLTMGAIVYLAVFHLQSSGTKRRVDIVMLCCGLLQLLLYMVSGYMERFTRFNLYFAVDIVLTLTLVPHPAAGGTGGDAEMTYIENIFRCLAIPLILPLFFTKDRARSFIIFMIAGMGVYLLSAYVSSFSHG